MAIVQNTLIGKTKKSVGGTTFTSWKGRNVLKSKAVSVSNPKTAGQKKQRLQFSGTTKFYAKNKIALMTLFNRFAGNITSANKFTMLNIKNFMVTTEAIDTTKVENMIFGVGSMGDFLPGVDPSVASGTAITAKFTYVANPTTANIGDMLRVFGLNASTGELRFTDVPVDSKPMTVTQPLVANVGDTYASYVVAYSTLNKGLSNSAFLGSDVL